MSNPDNAATHEDFPEDNKASTEKPSFDAAEYETQVVTACNDMKFGDDGKWQPPEDMSSEMQYAVNSERRRRDTQRAHTKAQQELKASTTKATALEKRLEKAITPNLTVEQAEELEDLKGSDAEAWRDKLNEYDALAFEEHSKVMEEIDADSSEGAEEVRRTEVLKQFLSDNSDLTLNDDVFNNDLPQRITGRLEEGKVTFEEFLEEAKEYLTKGKRIAGSEDGSKDEPNLSTSGGSSKPDADAVKKGAADSKSYEKEIF